MSEPLTFRELEVGEKFVSFPVDGDDSGHGGYRRGSYLFIKTSLTTAINMQRGVESEYPSASKARVLLVLTYIPETTTAV